MITIKTSRKWLTVAIWLTWTVMDDFHGLLSWMTFMDDYHRLLKVADLSYFYILFTDGLRDGLTRAGKFIP